MDIISAKALETVQYDKTIECTITSVANAKEGKYEVSDGSKIFEAYSNDTELKVDTAVYVTIP
jgi:hypothetical protein